MERVSQTAAPAATIDGALHSSILCRADDKIVFSCPLAKSTRIVSICAANAGSKGEPQFYYAFGRPGAIELRFPAAGTADNTAFTRTHLGFAGNTGGYAYAFTDGGYKYIVYSVSGSGVMREGGVIVQPADGAGAATKLACRSSAITETADDAVIDATLRLKKDADLQTHGLPDTP